jgi:ribosomal subunit interface protein
MKIIIKTKNLELTPSLESFIEEKISSLKKFIDILKEDIPEKGKTLAEVFVEVGKETNHHRKGDIFRAELQVRLPGKNIVVQASSDDLYRAVVEAKKELKLEIEQYKLKSIDKNRREVQKTKNKIEK